MSEKLDRGCATSPPTDIAGIRVGGGPEMARLRKRCMCDAMGLSRKWLRPPAAKYDEFCCTKSGGGLKPHDGSVNMVITFIFSEVARRLGFHPTSTLYTLQAPS